MRLHCVHHHAPDTATAEGFYEDRGKRFDEIRIDAEEDHVGDDVRDRTRGNSGELHLTSAPHRFE